MKIEWIPWTYFKEFMTKWYAFLGFLPGIYDLLSFYVPQIRFINFPLWLILTLAILSFILANYLVWLKLWVENKGLKDKEPKLDLMFDNNQKELVFQSKIKVKKFEEKQESSHLKQLNFVNDLMKSVSASISLFYSSQIEQKIIKEIREEYIPVSLVLTNNGNSIANSVYVDLEFPEDVSVLEDIPSESHLFHMFSILHSKKDFTFVDKKNKSVQLHTKESQHPYKTEFPAFYIKSDKKKEFQVNYVINAKEISSNKIKGKLSFKSEPIFEAEIIYDKKQLNEEKTLKDSLLKDGED